MKVFYPTTPIKLDYNPIVFLAGSIEMGKAEQWQEKYIQDNPDLECNVFNPRRKDWDPTWENSLDNPKFVEQVNWELDGIEMSDVVLFYFQPGTVSAISLMELGLAVGTKCRIIVCCPKGYFKKGNVDIICRRNDIPVKGSLEEAFFDLNRMVMEL